MYEIFEQLLAANNTSSYQVAKATGIATATLSDWKRGRSNPKPDKLQKIADYFDIPVDYLLTGKIPELPCTPNTLSLAQNIEKRPALKTLIESALSADESDILLATEVLKALCAKKSEKSNI